MEDTSIVTVTAIRDFDYNGRTVAANSVFRMPAFDAMLHMNLQNVSGTRHPGLSLASLQPDPEPEPATVIPPRRKRSYRRRDLTAESS